MNIVKKISIIPIFILFILSIFTCEKNPASWEGNPKEIVYNDNVVFMKFEEVSEPIINGEQFTFSYTGAKPNINTNDVIVGETGLGYMRKIDEMDSANNKLIFNTSQAILTDVIQQLSLKDTIDLNLNNAKFKLSKNSQYDKQLQKLPDGIRIDNNKIYFENKLLNSKNVNGQLVEIRAKNGYISFPVKLFRDIDIKWLKIEKFELGVIGSVECDFELSITSGMQVSDETWITGYWYPAFIGLVPVIVDIDLYLGYDLSVIAKATVKCDATAEIKLGAKYEYEQWSPIWTKSMTGSPSIDWDAQSTVKVRCYGKPKLAVLITGIIGPTLSVEPYYKFEGTATVSSNKISWNKKNIVGLSAFVGFDISLLGFISLHNYEHQMADWSKILSSQNGEINLSVPPSVTTNSASSVGQTSATLNGNVTSDGGATVTQRGFYYSSSDNTPDSGDNKVTVSGTTGSYNKAISGLASSTTYYFRAFATNSQGTNTGSVKSFTTGTVIVPPSVTTNSASSVGQTSATLNGNVTSDGGATVTQRGFYYSSSDNTPDSGDNKVTVSGTTGSYNKAISGLASSTTYYFRAFATNSQGTNTGSVKSFTTGTVIVPPSVTTNSASSVGQTSATLNGNVTSDGGATVTQRGFYYSSSDNTPDSGDNKVTVSGTTGSYNKAISGLASSTTYYFRAFATNSQGTNTGSVKSFTTGTVIVPPSVTTNSASSVGQTSATLNGNVTSDGGATVTQRGFYYSSSDNTPDSGDNKVTVSGTTGSYNKAISGLASSTTYYFRAFATNSQGTNTGSVKSFTTGTVIVPPSVTTNSASSVGQTSATLNGNVTSDGGATVTQRGFYYSSSDNTPDSGDNKVTVSGTTGSYNKAISGLASSTTYYFRAFATNSQGTNTGSVKSFTTGGSINVALQSNGGTASAISEGSYGGIDHPASLAIDGDKDTQWASQWSMPAWVIVEFDKIYTIDKVAVWWWVNQHTFSISLSENGSTWTTVVPSRLSNNPGFNYVTTYEQYPITPRSAKYIKIDMTTTNAPSGYIFQAILGELEAYGY